MPHRISASEKVTFKFQSQSEDAPGIVTSQHLGVSRMCWVTDILGHIAVLNLLADHGHITRLIHSAVLAIYSVDFQANRNFVRPMKKGAVIP